MPSPFPGMDPYLEHPALWPDVHNSLIAVCREMLVPLLRPRFWVGIDERVYVEREEAPSRAIRPDLAVSTAGRAPATPGPSHLPAGFVEVAELTEVPCRETFLVVQELPSREVVTVVEILSPSNKRADGQGLSEYLRKRDEVLATRTSLVEIDLLRAGKRPPYAGHLEAHDFLVLVHRGWERPRAWARGWQLRDPIPTVPIPLLPGEDPVLLDLAHALRTAYQRGAYDAVIDYARPPEPKLTAGDAAWVEGLLAH